MADKQEGAFDPVKLSRFFFKWAVIEYDNECVFTLQDDCFILGEIICLHCNLVIWGDQSYKFE